MFKEFFIIIIVASIIWFAFVHKNSHQEWIVCNTKEQVLLIDKYTGQTFKLINEDETNWTPITFKYSGFKDHFEYLPLSVSKANSLPGEDFNKMVKRTLEENELKKK